MTPTTKTSTSFQVSIKGQKNSSFSPDGYSQFNARYRMYHQGLIPSEQIYGYDQAVEHAGEIRNRVYNDGLPYMDAEFVISVITTVTTEITVTPAARPLNAFLTLFFKEQREVLPEVWIKQMKGLTDSNRDVFTSNVYSRLSDQENSILIEVRRFLQDASAPTTEVWMKHAAQYAEETFKLKRERKVFLRTLENTLEIQKRLAK